ncbi:Rieske 2Fe-2S domain-containing protein [Burkholderia metallica]|uniref:Rieske 2Fe-2S domain-containing protein n=1 Tax=Burkholderia metallica TaxID=488729 RepID=UPI001CF47E90|nr:Rieske 2Fe-2S domain-containing protein [Burkholderia metallica]MCA8023602.1 Rieske 2Fe-2S domain-containing protein [Burkholderia metallica]
MADKDRKEPAWFALCDVDRLGDGAIYHTELHGNECVVWRAEDGTVNVWENRCPHRGVRLSLGHHRGDALQCQYHGWQFNSGSGVCRFVPAHPAAAAPPVAVKTWPVEVRYGFVWTCLAPCGEAPPFAPIEELEHDAEPNAREDADTRSRPRAIRLRTVAIDAPSETVQRALADYCFDHARFDPWQATECVAFDVAPHAVMIEQLDNAAHRAVFLVQPARAGRTYLHGVALAPVIASERLTVQRHHQQRLNMLRDELEQQFVHHEPHASNGVADRLSLYAPQTPSLEQPIFLQCALSKPVAASGRLNDRNLSAGDDVADRPFNVHLSRSGRTLEVAAGVSVLQALRDHGIDVPSSCEQGVCGTCRTRVIEGTPLHRDVFLTRQERALGDCMMVCVSRAATETLILDL